MAANLKNLIRLHEWNVDEKRRKVAELQQLENELRVKIETLQTEMVTEKQAATDNPVEGGMTYPNYIQHATLRRDNLMESLSQMEYVISLAREEMAEAFRELKKFENVDRNRQRRQIQEEVRRDQAVSDEVALNMHRRKKA